MVGSTVRYGNQFLGISSLASCAPVETAPVHELLPSAGSQVSSLHEPALEGPALGGVGGRWEVARIVVYERELSQQERKRLTLGSSSRFFPCTRAALGLETGGRNGDAAERDRGPKG